MRQILRLLVVGVVGFCASTATADFTHITNVTSNDPDDVTIGLTQMTIEFFSADLGGNTASFTFRNIGEHASSITQIYFYDGVVVDIGSIVDSGGGVNFIEIDKKTGHLPGLPPPKPFAILGWKVVEEADPTPPTQPSGVNPGEWLKINITTLSGKTAGDLWTSMHTLDPAGYTETFIGFHVQGYDGGGSESFMSTVTIPAPGAALLAAVGIGLVGWVKRRLA